MLFQSQVKNLERRVEDLETENLSARDEVTRLNSEKAALLATVKRLNKDITRLDAFKRNLIQTLQDDETQADGTAEPPLLALGSAGSPPGYGGHSRCRLPQVLVTS